MTLGAKILLGAAVLCFLLFGIALGLGIRPLAPSTDLQIVYAEHEDFYADAVVYRPLRSGRYFLLNLPRARPAYRWWVVDFSALSIRNAEPPRSFRSLRFLLKNEPRGISVDDRERMGEWNWHFTEAGASFAGNGFTCSVRRKGLH